MVGRMAQPSHRDQLIRGAIKCLRTKGYARTTARDIAAASDANLASIGYHFGSKEGLLNEALIRIFKRRNWRVGEAALGSEDASAFDRLRATFIAAGEVFNAPKPFFVSFVEAIAQADHSPELREQMAAHYREARADAAATIRRILGPTADELGDEPDIMAALLMALFDGLVLQWLLDPDETPSGGELFGALASTMRVVLDGAKTPKSRRRRTVRA
jgi:AcrR family transcriptional regulator